jgi:hypothetical protein
MKNRTIVALLIVAIIIGAGVGYLVGVTSQSSDHPTTLPNVLYMRMIVAASCSHAGNTGAIIAINTGDVAVNLTEVTISDSSGIHVGATFQHAIIVNSGRYLTLSQGIEYSGSNVTIGALSTYGNLYTTSCHA